MKLFAVFAALSLVLRLPSAEAFTAAVGSLAEASHRRLFYSGHAFSGRHRRLTADAVVAEDNNESGDTQRERAFKAALFGDVEAAYKKALKQGQQFVSSIRDATIESIPNSDGMSVARNVLDLETGESRNIILRSITTPFWQACIDAVNTPGSRIRIAAIGTPGTGKTTSITPWLIRMLLEQGHTVVYLIRSEKSSRWYYEFVPNQDGPATVKIYSEKLSEQSIPSLQLPSTYYIVDPGKTKDNCNPTDDFDAKVILVTSPDLRHWGGSDFEKQRGTVLGKFRYFPTWSEEELVLAQPFLGPNMSEDQVRDRFRQLGG